MIRVLFALMVLVVLFLPGDAAAVTRKFCVIYDVSYEDEDTGDRLTDPTVIARGVKIHIDDNDSSDEWTLYADVTGADAGCVSQDLNAAHDYEIRLFAHAEVQGNTAKVTNLSHVTPSTVLAGAYDPSGGSPATYHVGVSSTINILAAATWGLYDGVGSLSGEVFEFHADSALNLYTVAPEIFIHDDDFKFNILHEMGHQVFDAATGYLGTDHELGADVDDCGLAYSNGSHFTNSKEYQSTAVWEGIADFYAAHALNVHTYDADCDFYTFFEVDWDLDGDRFDDPDDPRDFSCEDGLASPAVDSLDYFSDFCDATGEVNNRGTQYDWLRMWWDMCTDQSLSVADIQELWVLAGPDAWNEDGDGTGANYPATRFSTAAFDFGGSTFQDEWDEIAHDQGVDR